MRQIYPRLLFVDSGLGGLTILSAVRRAVPEGYVAYIADDAAFPYGDLPEAQLTARLLKLVGDAIEAYRPDCIVVACNTASTIALPELRKAFPIPIVGTVPAIKPAAAVTRSGYISVVATPATIAREYTHALIARFGEGAQFHLIAAPKLAQHAEDYAKGVPVEDAAIAEQIAPCFVEGKDGRTDVVVLGCTHYPLLLPKLETLAPWPVTWLDPAPAIARRVANILAERGHVVGVGARQGPGVISFTSGNSPASALQSLLQAHQVELAPSLTSIPAA
jgi:glutamate racemase